MLREATVVVPVSCPGVLSYVVCSLPESHPGRTYCYQGSVVLQTEPLRMTTYYRTLALLWHHWHFVDLKKYIN